MKLHILSDIHTEFYTNKSAKEFLNTLPTQADVLILAGDISVGRTNLVDTLKFFADKYEQVIYVPGNHEYYSAASYGHFRNLPKVPNNVHSLDVGTLLLGKYVFIGATLWSDLHSKDPNLYNLVQRQIPDFRRMPDNTPEQFVQRHQLERDYIMRQHDEYENSEKIIITHFLPSPMCISDRWKSGYPMNYYFAAHDMDHFVTDLKNTPLWVFGHTHDPIDLKINSTRFVCSPYGYPGETPMSTKYVPKVVELC